VTALFRLLKRMAFWAWPPLEAALASRVLSSGLAGAAARQQEVEAEVRRMLPSVDSDALRRQVDRLCESEARRKETIEAKATTYLVGIGIAGGLVTALPTLFGDSWGLSKPLTVVVATLHLLAVIHFFVAAFAAVDARRIAGFAMPSADFLLNRHRGEPDVESERDDVRVLLADAKFNEPILTRKMNSLSVAEAMFLRGLFLISTAAVCLIGGKLSCVLR